MSTPRKTSRVFRINISDEEHQAEARRSAIFDGWLTECAGLQESIVEQLLLNIPSLKC